MDEILEQLAAAPAGRDLAPLRALIATLRPRRAEDAAQATQNLRALTWVLSQKPALARALRHYLERFIGDRKLVHLCTDVGILDNQGFGEELWRRVNHKWLPPTLNDEYLKDVLGQVFHHKDDHLWVSAIDDADWDALLRALGFRWRNARALHAATMGELLDAIRVLSYRISAIGLEPELVRNHPDIERFESPFLRQNAEIVAFVERYQGWLHKHRRRRDDARHIEVLLEQCGQVGEKIRRNAAQNGVSISLTRLLIQLSQSIERLRVLLDLVDPETLATARHTGIRLFKALVAADAAKWSVRELFQTNTELLALQVTERAGRTGEHYVTTTLEEWRAMLRSASGAGLIVGFMAMLKVLAGKLALAPFGYAFLYSLNYSFGFMLVHVLHFTIATKQPAMTAATIAATLHQTGDIRTGKIDSLLDDLSELIVRVWRSQFVAVVGNVAIAMPVAAIIAGSWHGLFGEHLANPDKVAHLLHDLDPLHSLALPHAAVAGVFLFLSGLISGYYDNKAAYNQIPERLRQLGWLRHLLGEARLWRMTTYIGNNLGALAGNFFFGIMLGSAGILGQFFGLPIDIRHITFSSANFIFALVGADGVLSNEQWVLSLTGIALIGLTNLGVSFSLALGVALRSRRISFSHGRRLLWRVLQRFARRPRDFFVPPKETAPIP